MHASNSIETFVQQSFEDYGHFVINTNDPGLSDLLVFIGKCPHHKICPYLKFREVKSGITGDKLSDAQWKFAKQMKELGFDADVIIVPAKRTLIDSKEVWVKDDRYIVPKL